MTHRWHVIAVFAVILLFSAIRWRLRDMPLERDEGEYGYAGQLILQGIPPYKIAYNMKLPGTYAAYALIMAIFGQTAAAIHLGLLLTNALTIGLIFLLAKRLLGDLAAVVAAATYALLSINPWLNGFAGHATHFVVLFAIAGLLLLLQSLAQPRPWKFFLSGFLLGLAFLMKQPGLAFTLFGALYLLWSQGRNPQNLRSTLRHLLLYTAGAILPFALTCLLLWRAGVFPKFWFWTFSYASQYATANTAAEGWAFFLSSFTKISSSALALWLLAALGVLSLVPRKTRIAADFLLGLFFFSFLAVSAGLYFRGHYFILLLPAVSLFAGLAIRSAAGYLRRSRFPILRLPLAIFLLAFASALFQESWFYFRADPISASRYAYPYDPFPETVAVGDYLQQHASPGASIAVFGSEPQILFYSRRRSASGFLYGYSLTEEQKYASVMQRDMIAEIEAARPEYFVYVFDWKMQPRSDWGIFNWVKGYLGQNYQLVGVMRIRDGLQMRSEEDLQRIPGSTWTAEFIFRRTTP